MESMHSFLTDESSFYEDENVFTSPANTIRSTLSEKASAPTNDLYNVSLGDTGNADSGRTGMKFHFSKFCRRDANDIPVAMNSVRMNKISSFSLMFAKKAVAFIGSYFLPAVFSSYTILCLALTVCASLFYETIKASLLMLQNNSAMTCALQSKAMVAPYVASAVQIQALKSLNATIWNMNQSAYTGVDTLLSSYSNSSAESSRLSNDAARNATESMASWSQTQLDKLWNSTRSLNSTLNSIENSLAQSGFSYRGGMPNITIQKVSVPKGYNVANFSRAMNRSSINSALHAIDDSISTAQQSLGTISKSEIPVVNSTAIDQCGLEYDRIIKNLYAVAVTWIVIFSVFTIVCVIIHMMVTYYFDSEPKPALISSLNFATSKQSDFIKQYVTSQWGSNVWDSIMAVIKDVFQTTSRRMIALGVFMLFAGISSAVLLASVNKSVTENSAQGSANLTAQMQKVYSTYQDYLNDHSYQLLGELINNLNSNYNAFRSAVVSQYNFTLTDITPFANGVALDHIDFPLANLETETFISRIGLSKRDNMILPVIRKLSTGLCIGGALLIGFWLLYVVGVIVVTVINRRAICQKTPTISAPIR